MKLIDYLKERSEAVNAFALRIAEPEGTIRKIAYGQRQPSLPLSVKITNATDGKVAASDMILDDPNSQAAA